MRPRKLIVRVRNQQDGREATLSGIEGDGLRVSFDSPEPAALYPAVSREDLTAKLNESGWDVLGFE